MNDKYVFVSLISEDKEKASYIFSYLDKNEIRYHFSEEFTGGDNASYKKAVYPAVENCSYLIAAISEKASKDINMHFEVSIAKENEKLIIPVLLSDFDLKKESPCWEYLIGDAKIRKIEK